MLAAISIVSCIQPKPAHEIETVNELMDSLMNRGGQVYRNIYYHGDSTYQENYWYCEWFYDTCKQERKDIQLFLMDRTPELLDRVCKKAEKSYRYCSSDTLNYSLTISNKPKEMVSFNHYKKEENCDVIDLAHSFVKPARYSSNPYDAKPIQTLLQKFIAEQQDVRKFETCYEWDEGVQFPPFEYDGIQFGNRWGSWWPDSLAASKVTGTLYHISVKDESSRDSMTADFTNRLTRMITERPILGIDFQSFVYPGEKPGERTFQLQSLNVIDWKTRRKIYGIHVFRSGTEIDILEYNAADAPRFALPVCWWSVLRSHNTEITFIKK